VYKGSYKDRKLLRGEEKERAESVLVATQRRDVTSRRDAFPRPRSKLGARSLP